jgi:hypothetical protein
MCCHILLLLAIVSCDYRYTYNQQCFQYVLSCTITFLLKSEQFFYRELQYFTIFTRTFAYVCMKRLYHNAVMFLSCKTKTLYRPETAKNNLTPPTQSPPPWRRRNCKWRTVVHVKGIVLLDFRLQVFLWISFPEAQSFPLGPFRIFQKFAGIFAAQGVQLVSVTLVANGQNLQ